jgi:hypothetical protein
VGARLPAPGEFILKDITQWKKIVTIPDVEQYDWQKIAEEDAALFKFDRDTIVSWFLSPGSGIWMRLAALMGFEEAMIAMIEEPGDRNDLFTAVTDYIIRLAEKAAKYYKADVTSTNHYHHRVHWTCSITRLVIEQVLAKCSAFCFFERLLFRN